MIVFTADNNPLNAGEVEFAEVLQERLDGEESNGGGRQAQMLNARQSVLTVEFPCEDDRNGLNQRPFDQTVYVGESEKAAQTCHCSPQGWRSHKAEPQSWSRC